MIAGGSLGILLVCLLTERIRLLRAVHTIPLRIGVTGTRGKSSVTRLIAAALRESGKAVLARTTGSMPVLIFPDGREEEIVRRGLPTILEGKGILHTAHKLGADVCVVELMGIHPESIYVEAQKILKPHILVVTNVRLDHMAQMGETKDSIASCFAGAIPKGGTIFVLQEEDYPIFQRTADERSAKIIRAEPSEYQECLSREGDRPLSEFEENIRLSLAVATFLGQDAQAALRAMRRALPDFGTLKAWTSLKEPSLQDWCFVSGFAANEPQSTQAILSKLRAKKLFVGRTVIGILNLREDRADRTLQWFDALKAGKFPDIQKLICVGDHVLALVRKLKKWGGIEVYSWSGYQPEEIMAGLAAIEKEKAVVIGMGNMGGTGRQMVDFWEKAGKRYDL